MTGVPLRNGQRRWRRRHRRVVARKLSVEALERRDVPSFVGAALNYDVGPNPNAVAAADFNGDGIPDLAVADLGAGPTYTGGGLTVLLGNGDGSFRSRHFGQNVYASAVVAGDLNGDGQTDLVMLATNGPSNGLYALLGNGDGSFRRPVQISLSTGLFESIALADLNGDGNLDIVATDSASGVDIFLGNGDGSFGGAINHFVYRPTGLAVGDFNGDGIPDLAVASAGNPPVVPPALDVLLGNGDGSFQDLAPSSPTAGSSLMVGDFNNDGRLDIVGLASSSNMQLFLGNGDGTFQPPHLLGPYEQLGGFTVGDVNNDGRLDIVFTNSQFGGVEVLEGVGDGTFQAPLVTPGCNSPSVLVLSDLNGDGNLDVAALSANEYVSVRLGKGDGSFQTGTIAASPYAVAIATADLNGDGNVDMITTNNDSGSLSVFLGNGDGSFQPHQDIAAIDTLSPVAVGDLNGDGVPDLATISDDGVIVLLGNGDGTFQAPYVVGMVAEQVVVADVNGDGRLDLVTADGYGSVDVLLGNGDGTFETAQSYPAGDGANSVAVGDLNGDGKLDLAVANSGVSVLLGNGDGSFQAPQSYGAGQGALKVVLGDFNGDGHLDLATLSTAYPPSINILLGNGDGTFQPSLTAAADPALTDFAVGDFNRDGRSDLAVAVRSGVGVRLSNGDGTFQPSPVLYGPGPWTISVGVGDFNGDGFPDLASGDLLTPAVSVALNAADWAGGAPAPRQRPSKTGAPGLEPFQTVAEPSLDRLSPTFPAPLAISAAPDSMRESGKDPGTVVPADPAQRTPVEATPLAPSRPASLRRADLGGIESAWSDQRFPGDLRLAEPAREMLGS